MKREILEKVGLGIRSIPPDSFKPTFSNSYVDLGPNIVID